VRRVKADASLHANGKPLRAIDAPAEQRLFEDFGCTYRERLLAVEREVRRLRLAPALGAEAPK
jgi:hypothetical protein